MKRILILVLCIVSVHVVFAGNKTHMNGPGPSQSQQESTYDNQIPANYQQFKHSLLYQETQLGGIPASNYRGRTDNTMLYVAGGMAVVTTALVVLSSNSDDASGLGDAGTGILIGGGLSTVIFTTKFFVDKYR